MYSGFLTNKRNFLKQSHGRSAETSSVLMCHHPMRKENEWPHGENMGMPGLLKCQPEGDTQ